MRIGMISIAVFMLAAACATAQAQAQTQPRAVGAAFATLHVGAGQPYATLRSAAAAARPGDTIVIHGGTLAGGEYIENLRGTPEAWISIRAAEGETPVFSGGGEAWHLTDAAYLRIAGIAFEGQTGNGVNIDDGGSYDTPSHHLAIERCAWRGMNATGNNDQLKLSGVDSFTVRGCSFENGSAGGSQVDMVGCHDAVFEDNRFRAAGSNCIQAKGGSRGIVIQRNRFTGGGERALNIGGSTGAPYFRPLNANYEAAEIAVFANVFIGAQAPVAFVGAVRCAVINNTIFRPGKWAMRILQETVGANYLPCSENSFRNNIVVLGAAAANPTVNIGPNTQPETFAFSNNLWFNVDNPTWAGPNLPVLETDGLTGRDPLFADTAAGDFSLLAASPAIGAGMPIMRPILDYTGRAYRMPPAIGAFEYTAPAAITLPPPAAAGMRLSVYPQPAGELLHVSVDLSRGGETVLRLHDLLGRERLRLESGVLRAGTHRITLSTAALPPGIYALTIESVTMQGTARVAIGAR